jgi:hypothetical protein
MSVLNRAKPAKGQSAVEFTMLFIVLLVFCTGVYMMSLNAQKTVEQKRANMETGRMMNAIENEVTLALQMGDGYSRTFDLRSSDPRTYGYYIRSLGRGLLEAGWNGASYTRQMPTRELVNSTGGGTFNFTIGVNKITNKGGVVYIQGM